MLSVEIKNETIKQLTNECIRKQFITELKRNRINFDSDKANYIDDQFDCVLECVVKVVNKTSGKVYE